MNALDLFSGIGGISWALSDYCKTIAYCELDPYCQGVLLSRMASGDIDNAPIWDDVKTLDGKQFKGRCDIIFGGFPCQGISVAGLGKGLADERSGLFFEILRLAKEIKPNFIFLENVPAITSRGGLQIVKEIALLGYDCRWCIISAESVGAPHLRERWFLLTKDKSEEVDTYTRALKYRAPFIFNSDRKSSGKADQTSQPLEDKEKSWIRSSGQDRRTTPRTYWEENKRPFPGMDDGLPFELDRAFALGNSVCVSQCKEAFKELMGLKSGGE